MDPEVIHSQLFLPSKGVCTDTRKLQEGQLYISLKGENHDGNRYAREAVQKGAVAAIVDDSSIQGEGIVQVKDGLQTLQELARTHRQKLRIPVIAITGSNGKTTTKELASRVLSKKYRSFATPGNLNNHIGLPLSVLSIDKEHEIALLEFGANHPGENQLLAGICKPTHGLVTNVGLDHLEGFGDQEGVFLGNKELVDALAGNEGHVFYHIDDPWIRRMVEGVEKRSSYGREPEANIRGNVIKADPFLEVEWAQKGGESATFRTSLIGTYNLPNILAALSIGNHFGIQGVEMEEAISSYEPDNKRSEIVHTERNTVIMDAYNANPSSMEAAIESFLAMEGEKKRFILGDMLELGHYEEAAHEETVDMLLRSELNQGLLVGEAFQKAAEGKGIPAVKDRTEARKWLREKPFDGAMVLVKASRGLKLEELLDLL